jgi:hypothetical protein
MGLLSPDFSRKEREKWGTHALHLYGFLMNS